VWEDSLDIGVSVSVDAGGLMVFDRSCSQCTKKYNGWRSGAFAELVLKGEPQETTTENHSIIHTQV